MQRHGLVILRTDRSTTAAHPHRLSICRVSHTRCLFITSSDTAPPQRNTQTDLPTRVLYVGTSVSDEVRLFISNGTKGQYAALSHRWGSRDTIACTTTGTLSSRTSGIPLDSLSQLFRDAISVTRRLGLSYLWIDSLCILQDSREDWERESARMGDVFGCSEVTISAVASEDGCSGFLLPRDRYMVPANYRKSDTAPREGLIYFRRPKNRLTTTIHDSALNKRAWVIQERTLARRVLTFAKSQVFWECREMLAGEAGPQADNMDHFSRRLMRLLHDLSLDRNSISLQAEVYSAWRQLVEEVSEAGLTYESDRLFTILGLSAHVQRATQSEYICGTWADDLALELFWVVQPRNRKMFTCRLPSAPRAPSWCWSSLEGPIRFMRDDLKDCSVCFERIVLKIDTYHPLKAPQARWVLHLLALVRVCEVTKNGVNWEETGEPSIVTPDSDFWVSATKGGGFATLDETGQVIGGSRFDLQPTEDSLGMYSCLLLLESRSLRETSDPRYGTGLLLRAKPRPTEAQNTYMRVGTVSLSAAGIDWLRGVESNLITLI